MRSRPVALRLVAGAVIILYQAAPVSLAQTRTPSALTGQVASAEEGPMEGVVVSAAKAGSTTTVSVVSDEHGLYQFPRARLEPGRYSLSIFAVGYDLESPATVEIGAAGTSTADLKLGKARDLASQLSNTEWLMSFPGTEQQKASVRNCAHCHTLEPIARSRHNADAFVKVVERMSKYPPPQCRC